MNRSALARSVDTEASVVSAYASSWASERSACAIPARGERARSVWRGTLTRRSTALAQRFGGTHVPGVVRAALLALTSILWLAPPVELEVATATPHPTLEASTAEGWAPSPSSSRTAPAVAAPSVRRLPVEKQVHEAVSVDPLLDEAPRPERTQAPRWRRLPRMTVDGPGDG